ncbi:MAG: hypothetical protein K0R71_1218 [Bacillales bacterium]|jgi:predicted Zn-dependent protease|nr:hypothetical protein [Bacillales bacterium]
MNRLLSIFLIAILLVGGNYQIASAADTATPMYVYNLTWNIRNIYYYNTTSAQNTYATSISNAAKNWYYPGWTNSLNPFTRTAIQSQSAIDIYTYNLNDGYNGKCEFYIFGYSSNYDPDAIDWDWCKVKLNDYNLSGESLTYIQGVVAHEMGHAFGLKHNNTNQNSIMCESSSGRQVYTVQKVDNDSFRVKHP